VVGIVQEQWTRGLGTCNSCKIWMSNATTRLNNTQECASQGSWTPI